MTAKKRIAALILAFAMVFAMAFSVFFIAHNSEHSCTGEDCHICRQISICLNSLKNLIPKPAQAEKARRLSHTTFFAGAATGRASTMGVGMNSARYEMFSEFSRVKKVKPYPKRNLIKMKEGLSHNQIYVHEQNFDFVENYIVSHCENL
jgi:hypothetical protein